MLPIYISIYIPYISLVVIHFYINSLCVMLTNISSESNKKDKADLCEKCDLVAFKMTRNKIYNCRPFLSLSPSLSRSGNKCDFKCHWECMNDKMKYAARWLFVGHAANAAKPNLQQTYQHSLSVSFSCYRCLCLPSQVFTRVSINYESGGGRERKQCRWRCQAIKTKN